jgi:small multidrug resistance pump
MESMGSKKKPRPRRSFTDEFKAEIVELCQYGDRSIRQVARDFDLTDPLPTRVCLAGYAVSFGLVAQVVQRMPVGVVYAIWSGVGTAAVAGIGVVFLGESLDMVRTLGIVLVILRVVALNVGGAH